MRLVIDDFEFIPTDPLDEPDIQFGKIRFGQGVFEPSLFGGIDLVSGRSFVIDTNLSVRNFNQPISSVLVHTHIDNELVDATRIPITEIGLGQELIPITGLTPGPHTLSQEIDPENEFPQELDDGNFYIKIFNVHQTNPLSIEFVSINECLADIQCYLPTSQSNVNRIADESRSFLEEAFPNSPGTLNIRNQGFSMKGFVPDIEIMSSITTYRSLARDATELMNLKRITQSSRFVAIVDETYFVQHYRKSVAGLAFGTETSSVPATFVRQNTDAGVVAHELAHSFGAHTTFELYRMPGECGSMRDGFNPITGVIYSEQHDNLRKSFMCRYISRPDAPLEWADVEAYNSILLGVTSNLVDPKLTVISGVLEKNGTFSPHRNFEVMGFADESVPSGSVEIVSIDDGGSPISSTFLEPAFKIRVMPEEDDDFEDIESAFAPISVAILASETTKRIQLKYNGQVVYSVRPPDKNTAPILTTINTIVRDGESATITYDDLLDGSDASDPDEDTVSFRIKNVINGSLTKGNESVFIGETLINPGEHIVWSPPNASGDSDLFDSFEISAFDGNIESTNPVSVKIELRAHGATTEDLKMAIRNTPSAEFKRPGFFRKIVLLFYVRVIEFHLKRNRLDQTRNKLLKLRKRIKKWTSGAREIELLELVDSIIDNL